MKRISVYCSSREGLAGEVVEAARTVGRTIGELGYELVYGGVNAGLMHTVAQAAHDAGAKVTGVVPETFRHRVDPVCDELVYTDNLNVRKGVMIAGTDAFVVLPGGLGTIDEWISTLSDIMVREIADPTVDRPILVLNLGGMYDGMVSQLRLTAGSVFARGKRVDRSRIFADADSLAGALRQL